MPHVLKRHVALQCVSQRVKCFASEAQKLRLLAIQQRDEGLGAECPGPGYDDRLRHLWGGPRPRWSAQALDSLSVKFNLPQMSAGKLALVTGSTGGIGFYVAKALAQLGVSVLIPSRAGMEFEAHAAATAILETAAPGARASVPDEPLELTNLESVRVFAQDLLREYPALDILCLNAGRGGSVFDSRELTDDGHEAIMQVNSFSQLLLTCEIMPLLRASTSARVVSQSSGARFGASPAMVDDLDDGAHARTAWDQYCLSKAMNCLFTHGLNERFADAGLDSMLAVATDPGLAATGMQFQHDAVRSWGIEDRYKDSRDLHDEAGHHAMDAALAMTFASVDTEAKRNDFYVVDGRQNDLENSILKNPPASRRRNDPAIESDDWWSRAVRERFWRSGSRAAAADWGTAMM